MCSADPQQMDMLEKTVRQFLDEGRMFTAYDVTLETRDRESIQMRHKDVRGACHEISLLSDACDFGYNDPNSQTVEWDRSRVDMPLGKWAFVYHPSNLDPNDYRPQGKTQATATATATAQPTPSGGSVASLTTPSDSGGKNDDGSFSTDYRDRLFIPTSFLRDAGMKAGDECYVICDKNNSLIILAADGTNFNGADVKITTLRVERDGDLRLSSATLKSADLDADKFVIENTQESQTAVVKVGAKD